MTQLITKIGVGIIALLVGIQFIPSKLNQSDEVVVTDITNVHKTPAKIVSKLQTSCYDCHSNNTIYPWYSKIQPIRLLMDKHVSDAKKDLNFSEFGTYSKRKQKNKLRSILSEIEKNKMPLSSYTIMHKNAKLSALEKKDLTEWLKQIIKTY